MTRDEEFEKLHRRAVAAEELLEQVAQERPHQMYWVHRAKAAEAKLQSLSELEAAIVSTFNDMGLTFGSQKQGQDFFENFRAGCLRYYAETRR